MTRLVVLVACLAGAAGCKKERPVAAATQPAPPAAAPVDPRNTNSQSGMGAVQNVRQAAKRTASINDLHQLATFMEQMFATDGKMPGPAEVKEYIRRDAPKVVLAIEDGTIILTGTKNHAGLWAYEVDADKAGGLVLAGGVARRAEADEAKQMLAAK